MHINPSKCQVLHITRARNPLQTQYVLHGQILEAVDYAKYLGLEIGSDLNWNQHIQNVTTKAIGQWPDMVYPPPTRGNFVDHDFLMSCEFFATC